FNPIAWMEDVHNLMRTSNGFIDETLTSVVYRCSRLTAKDVSVNFLLMVNYMQLVVKCQRFVLYLFPY
ncbi:hypothetical protein BJ138DRAFT_1020862, partial [Hygrophoropsis aurantiaca]